MKLFFFISSLFLSVAELRAQALDHLIYRCDELHWECVSLTDYRICKEVRDSEILNEKKDLSCAEFEKFPSVRACEQRILFLTTHNFGSRFCLNDAAKAKELIFQ